MHNPHLNGKKAEVVSIQWKEEIPPSLEEAEEKKDSKETLYSTQSSTEHSSTFPFAHVHTSYPSAELQSCDLCFRVGLVCVLVLCLFLIVCD